jgi:hypothetical protein
MTSRRQFLIASLSVTALPAAARAQLAPERAGPAVPIYKVLYDTRFVPSVAFAERAAARGATVHAMRGDMTSFWYDDLYHRWRQGPAAIAGLTAHGALFCLERLAWEQRMRVVYRGKHSGAAGGGVVHHLEGPAALLARVTEVIETVDWAGATADAVLEAPSMRSPAGEARGRTLRAALPPPGEELFSWVIAPVRRA